MKGRPLRGGEVMPTIQTRREGARASMKGRPLGAATASHHTALASMKGRPLKGGDMAKDVGTWLVGLMPR